MDIYVLDDLRRREHIVDRFESFVWNERLTEMGEFEVVIQPTDLNRSIFVEGKWVIQNGSLRVMVVETLEDSEDSEGRQMLKVSGRSLEAVLEDRVMSAGPVHLNGNDRWELTGLPAAIARLVFKTICIDGKLDAGDKIPDISTSMSLLPTQTNAEPATNITIEEDIQSVYEFLTKFCAQYGLGFAFLLNPETHNLHFNIFSGSNRTAAQVDRTPVVFSPELENLSNVSEFTSSANFKNVAVVTSDFGMVTVYGDTTAHEAAGFERRVLLVKANIKEDDENKEQLMTKIGNEELAKHRRMMALDGSIPETGYIYQVDYWLGDIVEMRRRGSSNNMRVIEQIFSDDAEGEKSYPTLALESYIAPYSWYAYPPNDDWYDVDPDITWYNLPPNGTAVVEGPPDETEEPPTDKDPALYTAAVGVKITVPTHLSEAGEGGETAHPSLIDFGAGNDWNGYRYWMAHTPYPNASDTHSDPNIVASHDGFLWEVPVGLTNPIDDAPGVTSYNSGVDMVYAGSTMYLFWRRYTVADVQPEVIYMSTSSDGVTWSAKQIIWQTDGSKRFASPSFIYEDGAWTMYAVDTAGSPNKIMRTRSGGPIPTPLTWATPVEIPLELPVGRDAWRIQVRKIGAKYVGILNDTVVDVAGSQGDLYMMSSDDGLEFTRGTTVAIPRVGTSGGYAHTALARATIVPGAANQLDCYYSGYVLDGEATVWTIFRTTLL
jgi:hypothetical protein